MEMMVIRMYNDTRYMSCCQGNYHGPMDCLTVQKEGGEFTWNTNMNGQPLGSSMLFLGCQKPR